MRHKNQSFKNSAVELDDNQFFGCTFQKCKLIYRGGKPPSIADCSFTEISIAFEDYAQNTLVFMTALYHGGFSEIIEATFNNIRGNKKVGGNGSIFH